MIMAVIGAILAIGLLIVVHEAGHYFVARRCGMRVDRFSIGFGPPIFKRRRGETDFTIGPIPFGGFVQIHGMTLAEEVPPDDTRSYPNRPAWQRFLTIFAGPATNYLFAIVLGLLLFATAGVLSGTVWFAVAEVPAGSASQGILQPGDRILTVNEKPVYASYRGQKGDTLADIVDRSKGQPVKLTVLRGGEETPVVVTPRFDKEQKAFRLGIRLGYEEERARAGVGTVVGQALYYPVEKTKLIAIGLYEIVTGKQKPEVHSVVGITVMIKDAILAGWVNLLELLMILNVYLGLFNLLPLPALDGGRLVFLGYEMATRRRANPRIEATVHMIGIMALILLMVLVTYSDIRHF